MEFLIVICILIR